MPHQNDGHERPVDRVEVDSLDQLRGVIEQAAERGATRIQLGEGPGAIVLAEADRRRWRQCGGCTLCCTVAGVNEFKKPPMTPAATSRAKAAGFTQTAPTRAAISPAAGCSAISTSASAPTRSAPMPRFL